MNGKPTDSECLFRASAFGHASTVSALIAGGADPNERDEYGRTPLYFASGGGHASTVSALIAGGADPNLAGNEGWAPIHHAANLFDKNVVASLLAGGANPNARLDDGRTPLHLVATQKNTDVMEVLLAGGADPTVRCERGRTPRDCSHGLRGQALLDAAYRAAELDAALPPAVSRLEALEAENAQLRQQRDALRGALEGVLSSEPAPVVLPPKKRF